MLSLLLLPWLALAWNSAGTVQSRRRELSHLQGGVTQHHVPPLYQPYSAVITRTPAPQSMLVLLVRGRPPLPEDPMEHYRVLVEQPTSTKGWPPPAGAASGCDPSACGAGRGQQYGDSEVMRLRVLRERGMSPACAALCQQVIDLGQAAGIDSCAAVQHVRKAQSSRAQTLK